MDFNLSEWTNLAVRWVHVFAGILWVGATYYFTWLDGRFTEFEKLQKEPSKPQESDDDLGWMVHSGGFYKVKKEKVPAVMPGKLHWFRWEAATTWISGMLLFIMIYYHGRYLVPSEDPRINLWPAVALSLGLLIIGWVAYDLLWSSKIFANEKVGLVVSYLLVVLCTYGLFYWFAARAACVQLGAMFGTIMTANVWMRILPAQRRMVRALAEGKEPNPAEALHAKTRSKHNTFLVVPVVFLMLSNHFPGTYHWAIVSGLVLAGWVAANFIRRA